MFEACRNMITWTVSRATALRHCARGTVAVELAFYVPVAAVMITGAVEFGRLGLEQVRITSAAHAGAEFGAYSRSNAANIDGMVEAARLDADDVTNSLTVVAREFCRCPGAAEQACSILCGDDNYAPQYVEVSVSQDVDLWFNFPGIPATITLAADSTLRY